MKENESHSALKTLDRLLVWLAFYVVLIAVIAWISGKPAEVIPVLANLVSGFAGAAFAVMQLKKDVGNVRE